MPIPWFEKQENSGGILTTRLSTDCNAVKGMVTASVSVMIQNISSLISGIIIALVHDWRTALVAIALIPFMLLAGAIQMAMAGKMAENKAATPPEGNS